MLGTVFFDENTSSTIVDISFENAGATRNAASGSSSFGGIAPEALVNSENSFVSQCGSLQVVSWVDGGVAKLALLDRVGTRSPRMIRLPCSAPVVGVVVAELPNRDVSSSSSSSNTTTSADAEGRNTVVNFSVALCTADARVMDGALLASTSADGADDTITVQLVRYNWRDVDTERSCNGGARVTAFGLCSAPLRMRGEVSVAVALSNGATFLVMLLDRGAEDRVAFSVDADAAAAASALEEASENKKHENENNSGGSFATISGWFFGNKSANGSSSSSSSSNHQDPQQQQQRFVGGSAAGSNYVTSFAFCPQQQRLFFCCANGRLMFYDSSTRSPMVVAEFPHYLRCRQIMAPSSSEYSQQQQQQQQQRGSSAATTPAAAATGSPGGAAAASTTSPSSGTSGGASGVLFAVCDDDTSRYLMSVDSGSFVSVQHWSAAASTPNSRCVRIEPPHRDGLDMPLALWQVPEAGNSVLWSSAFGVAHIAAPVLSFFQAADDGLFCVVLPGSQLAVVREEGQLCSVELAAAGIAVSARPAVNEHSTVLFPTRQQQQQHQRFSGGGAVAATAATSCSSSILVHPSGGSEVAPRSADDDLMLKLPRAISAGILLLQRTQMWSALDESIGRLLTEPDASGSGGSVSKFVDAAALLEMGGGDDESISDDDMMSALCFVMDPANLVNMECPAAHFRSKRWVADRLSQSLFSGVLALFAARISWACTSEQQLQNHHHQQQHQQLRHAAVERNVALSLSLLCSSYQAVSALGPHASVLVTPAAADSNDSSGSCNVFATDVATIEACLATLLGSRHLYGSVVRALNNSSNITSGTDSAAPGLSQQSHQQQPRADASSTASSSVYHVVEDIAHDSERVEQAVVSVAHRLLVAAQTHGRTKALSMWVSYWQAECPIVNHFAAVLLAAHHTGDARPGVASLRFAQHIHTTCAAITSFAEREASKRSSNNKSGGAGGRNDNVDVVDDDDDDDDEEDGAANGALGLNTTTAAAADFGAAAAGSGTGGGFGSFTNQSTVGGGGENSTGMFAPAAALGGGRHKRISTKLAKLIIDLLHNTSATLGDSRQQSSMLDDIITFLDSSPGVAASAAAGNTSTGAGSSKPKAQHPELEACRLYRSMMLLLFLNDAGSSASFQCEPDLVDGILCDVQQVHGVCVASVAASLERLMCYLLVECSLFLSGVALQRRDFGAALGHLSTVCRNDGNRAGQVNDTVALVVQLALESPDTQQQLLAAQISDEPLLRAVNAALHDTILQAAQQQNVGRSQRHTACVQHTVFFCQFLAARGATGSAARIAHDVASLLRSFTRCSERTLRLVARLLSMAVDFCRAIPDVEAPNIVVSADGAVSANSSGGPSRRGELTGLGGQDMDVQQSMAFNLGQAGGGGGSRSFMVFRPSGVARRPLMRRNVQELQRRLRWVLCEAKLASRAPVNRPAWSDDLDGAAGDAEVLAQTVKELMHARLWNDAALLCEAYPEYLHPASVFQVRANDILGECAFPVPSSLALSAMDSPSLPVSWQQKCPAATTAEDFSNPLLAFIQRTPLDDNSSDSQQQSSSNSGDVDALTAYRHTSIDLAAGEDVLHAERSAQLTSQWVELLNDIDAYHCKNNSSSTSSSTATTTTMQRQILRRVVEQALTHSNGDNVPRFVFDALFVEEPATLLELCLNCRRTSLEMTNLAFDVVINFFGNSAAKFGGGGGGERDTVKVLPATLLERLVLGSRKQMDRARAQQDPALGRIEGKARQVEKLVVQHLQGGSSGNNISSSSVGAIRGF